MFPDFEYYEHVRLPEGNLRVDWGTRKRIRGGV